MNEDGEPEVLARNLGGWLEQYGLAPSSDDLAAFDAVPPDLLAGVRSVSWRIQRATMQRVLRGSGVAEAAHAVKLGVRRADIADAAATQAVVERTGGERDGDVAAFAFEAGDVLVSGQACDQAGRLVLRSITLEVNPAVVIDGVARRRADIPAGGLTSADLRGLSIPRILRQLSREAANAGRWNQAAAQLTPSMPTTELDALTDLMEASAGDRGSSFARRDSFLRGVALAYLVEQRVGRGVYRRLAIRYAPRPESTIRSWVGAAEQRGFLTSGTRGRQDRQPGPHLTDPPTCTEAEPDEQEHR